VITLSKKENKRAWVLGKVDCRETTAVEAGKVLGLSERQVRRLLAKYREGGPAALVHGNRGRKPKHAVSADIKSTVIELVQTKYSGFNHTHFTEKLEGEGIVLRRSSVRRILLEAGIKSPRKRRAPKHRSRRERRPQQGMMLQIDGSRHDWLEGRGPYLTLIGAIDDATGEVPYAKFRGQEDAQGYFLLLEGVVLKYGLPLSLYTDRHGIFVVNQKKSLSIEEELRGEKGLTQFGRALKELEVEAIQALSPQAKGRVERLWGTFQDRLVSELRLAGAKTLAEANEVLGEFLGSYNERFVIEPRDKRAAYRSLSAKIKLSEVLCFKHQRTVAKDNTVQIEGRTIQIPPGEERRSYARAKVTVHEGMDGSLGVYYQGRRIAYEEPTEESPVLRVGMSRVKGETREAPPKGETKKEAARSVKADGRRPSRPAAEHPWRKEGLAARALRQRQS
jgi:transposase